MSAKKFFGEILFVGSGFATGLVIGNIHRERQSQRTMAERVMALPVKDIDIELTSVESPIVTVPLNDGKLKIQMPADKGSFAIYEDNGFRIKVTKQ